MKTATGLYLEEDGSIRALSPNLGQVREVSRDSLEKPAVWILKVRLVESQSFAASVPERV